MATTSPRVQHYANEAARVVQDLCKSCRVPVILVLFILMQIGEPLNRLKLWFKSAAADASLSIIASVFIVAN